MSTPFQLSANSLNTTGTFNRWVRYTLKPELQTRLGLTIYDSFQKSDADKYPQLLVRWFVEQQWSSRRQQYYDACKLHVINNKNDDYNSRRITNEIMNIIGVSQLATQQIFMLRMQAISNETPADFGNPSYQTPYTPYKIEVRTEGGWETEEPDERIRHYVRQFNQYY